MGIVHHLEAKKPTNLRSFLSVPPRDRSDEREQ